MEEVVETLRNNLDYENNYYFYHETSYGNGRDICEEGLLVNGTNIVDAPHLLLTTSVQLTSDMTDDDNFAEFLKDETCQNNIRNISEVVILGIPKEDINFALQPLSNKSEKEYGLEANYILNSKYILGYVDLVNEEITLNENYFDYLEDFRY